MLNKNMIIANFLAPRQRKQKKVALIDSDSEGDNIFQDMTNKENIYCESRESSQGSVASSVYTVSSMASSEASSRVNVKVSKKGKPKKPVKTKPAKPKGFQLLMTGTSDFS